jgi:hypothetical protein
MMIAVAVDRPYRPQVISPASIRPVHFTEVRLNVKRDPWWSSADDLALLLVDVDGKEHV